jgi:peptide/nickel transport system ATP-binding protein
VSVILRLEDLEVHYRSPRGAVRAVDRANLSVPEGQIVGLVGESGCGKTTLARAVTGILPGNAQVVGGRIVFDGRDLRTLSQRQLRALRWREIAFVPQSAMNSLDPVYRVGAQLMEVLIERGGLSRGRARARAAELFELVGLDVKRLDAFPHQFSGGMRQRAAIALTLALEPKLIIADEPVTALDVVVQRQVLDTLRSLQQRLGISVVLVTHDISVVAYLCDQVAVMYAGRVVEAGPTASVLRAPAHPYTMGLYNAFPDLERARHVLTPIEGSPPDLHDPPAGCRFAPRCPFSIDVCADDPALEPVTAGHEAACWRAHEAAPLRVQAAEVSTWQRS